MSLWREELCWKAPYFLKCWMACVAASAGGGIPSVIEHSVNGLLAPPRDAQTLAASIGELLDDKELCRKLGLRARQVILDGFDWQRRLGSAHGGCSSHCLWSGTAAGADRG